VTLEERIERLEKRVQKLEDAAMTRAAPKSTEIGAVPTENVDTIATQDLVSIALRLKPQQTKSTIKNMLNEWGKNVGNWFEGGNLNSRLIKKSLIKKDGANEKNEDLFSLTKKGKLTTDKLIEKINS
jgi:ribosomal protein L11